MIRACNTKFLKIKKLFRRYDKNELYNQCCVTRSTRRRLHFASKVFLRNDTDGIALVDNIFQYSEKIQQRHKAMFSDNNGSTSVAFFFATNQSDKDVKDILRVLDKNFDIVIGNDNTSLCNSCNIDEKESANVLKNSDDVTASLLIGTFSNKCSLLTFSSKEHGMPPECLQLFSDRLKIDKEHHENSLNMLLFSTPSFDMSTVLGPINGLMPEASKTGSISYNRVFLGSNIYYDGFAGLSIQGNVAMDVVTTQPYENVFQFENASVNNGNIFSLSNTTELENEQLSYFFPKSDRILFPQIDGINGPGRETQYVTRYDEEKGEIEKNFNCFEFSGDILDDEDETSVVLLQENPMYMARNICVALQEHVGKSLPSLNHENDDNYVANYANSIAGMMMFSSYHGNDYYGTKDFEMNSWKRIVNTNDANVKKGDNNDNTRTQLVPSIGTYCKQGIGPSNNDGYANIFDESTTYAIFRELKEDDDLPSHYTFCDLTTNGMFEFSVLHGETVHNAQKSLNGADAVANSFTPSDNSGDMDALPVFKWDARAGQINYPGKMQEYICFEPRNRFLVAYCLANNKEFAMHFKDEDLCMKHKIYEYTEELNGDYKIKTIITGRCHLHGKPLYIPGFFGMTLSYCKDVNDCEIGAPINHSDVDDMSANIRKLLVNTMLLAQIEEENLKQYVAERDNMIANWRRSFF
jgi:hypothetical protein